MSTDKHFHNKEQAIHILTRDGYIKLPRQTHRTHFLPIHDIDYYKHPSGIIAGIREIRPQDNKKWLVFFRDPTATFNTPDRVG